MADDPEIMVDHESKHGPTVTHVRGIVLANSVANLKQWGVFEAYTERLPARHRDLLSSVVASSWVSIEDVYAHYAVVDRLELPDSEVVAAAERLAARVAETFFGLTLRASRATGFDPFEFGARRSDRLWDRMFQGGGCRVVRLGPKEVLSEQTGHDLFAHRAYRLGYLAYSRVLAELFCKRAYLKQCGPYNEGTMRFAVQYSWV